MSAIALAATAFAGACADETHAPHSVTVEVQPRVALTGGIELSDRSAGRVVIDEVVAHAPAALVTHADGVVDVVDDSAPLLFRYLLSDRSGFGAAVGGGRTWTLPLNGAALDVAFAPAPATLAASVGDDVDSDVVASLAGHTVVVHGTIAIDTDDGTFGTASGFGVGDVDPDGGAAEPADPAADVDPDGGAAEPTDSAADVDPDGGAAQPTNVASTTSDVDPDGGAAKPTTKPGTSDVDPDGGAAQPTETSTDDVDPDGGAAQPTNTHLCDVDPDGGAAKNAKRAVSDVDPDGGAAHGENVKDARAREQGIPRSAPRRDYRRGTVLVPFTVVADGSFALSVALSAEELGTVGAGEVLPIDLELSASHLLDADRLAILERTAREALSDDDDDEPGEVQLIVSRAVAGAASVQVKDGVKKPNVVAAQSSHVLVTSGGVRR